MTGLGPRRCLASLLAVWALILVSGCSTLISSATQGLTNDLAGAILDSDDPELIRDGAPSYLIMIDGLLAGSPEDAALLSQAAQLNSAYASGFVSDAARARKMHDKALDFAFRSVCLDVKDGCRLVERPFPEFSQWLSRVDVSDIELLYVLGSTWASWLQANSEDFSAIAQLARVKALMLRLADVAPRHDDGGVYLYLGVFETLLPPGMGGKPDVGRAHFERALELSDGQNLFAKVMFAESYARLVFDRELHDQLLTEVLDTPAKAPGRTLMNTVAQARAQELLESADAFF